MTRILKQYGNDTPGAIARHVLQAFISLFLNGFGIYLTIRANIGVAPWDVLNMGVSKTLGILYGTASITISCAILAVDALMREPIGLAMFIDAFVVGKAVDFFNRLNPVPLCMSLWTGVPVVFLGLVIIAYTQYAYMAAALGCGPRDTLMVGLAKRLTRVPIGLVSSAILAAVTLIGWLLGGPVGVGTLISAFCAGPIMQLAFQTVGFDAKRIRHQHLRESLRILFPGKTRRRRAL